MSDGRLTDVVLLDDQHLEIVIQFKLLVHELMGMVASHCNIRREKHFFGLSFRDETGHYQWLQLDKHVLEHEFTKKSGTITLYFQVKFYIESILLLMERNTVILFYLQSKQLLCKGLIETDSETIFELSAYILQVTHGDYVDDTMSRSNLKNFQLSRKILEVNPSIAYCEDQIISYYKRLCGLTAGSALINYMSIVESLPTYGIHYYGVKDKSGIPWWMGVGVRGISLFDHADKKIPRKFFPWKSLENLFFRDRKFTIEVNEPKSTSKKSSIGQKSSSSSSTDHPSSTIVAHTWVTPTTNLARNIWTMAVSQHQFYLDRKHSKGQSICPWNVEDLRFELDNSNNTSQSSSRSITTTTTTTTTDDVMNSSISAPNLVLNSRDDHNQTLKSQSSRRDSATSKFYDELKSRRRVLEDKLNIKLQEFKGLCLKEAELTGFMPEDLQRFFRADEIPQMRRRVGTGFLLSSKILDNDLSQADDLTQLEISYEVQEKLMTAAFKLAQDKSRSKTIRKKMRQDYQLKQIKLKELEERINELRVKKGKELLHARSLEGDFSEDSREFLDDDIDDVINMKSLNQKKPAFHSSFTSSQNEDPDQTSTYSSTSNNTSSSTTSLPDQQHHQHPQQSPSSGIKFYPKKKLPESSHARLHHSNSNKSNRSNLSNACPTPTSDDQHTLTPPTFKSDRRASNRSSGRVEGRRKTTSHFNRESMTNQSTNNKSIVNQSSRGIAGAADVSPTYYHPHHVTGSVCNELVTIGHEEAWKCKYNSLDRRRKSSGHLRERIYRGHDGPMRRGSMELSHLIPSKYGSKRDSTLEDDDEDDDDDDDTLGKLDHDMSSSTMAAFHYLPNSTHHLHHPSYPQFPTHANHKENSDPSVNSRVTTPMMIMTMMTDAPYKSFHPSCPQSPAMYADSTSSGSSNSIHHNYHPPLPARLEFRHLDKPSGPDKLTRVVTDVRVLGPCPAPYGRPVGRDQRNEEAVDALFKHYEEKILPSRMMSTRDSTVGDDDDGGGDPAQNQSLKLPKPRDYLTSPRVRQRSKFTNKNLDHRSELNKSLIQYESSKKLIGGSSTLPKLKNGYRFSSTAV